MTFKTYRNTSQPKKAKPTDYQKQNTSTLWTDANAVQHPEPQNHLTDICKIAQASSQTTAAHPNLSQC